MRTAAAIVRTRLGHSWTVRQMSFGIIFDRIPSHKQAQSFANLLHVSRMHASYTNLQKNAPGSPHAHCERLGQSNSLRLK